MISYQPPRAYVATLLLLNRNCVIATFLYVAGHKKELRRMISEMHCAKLTANGSIGLSWFLGVIIKEFVLTDIRIVPFKKRNTLMISYLTQSLPSFKVRSPKLLAIKISLSSALNVSA